MGSRGAFIMSFFGALFAAMTLDIGFGWHGTALAVPFAVFAAIALWAWRVLRQPGAGLTLSRRAGRVILWSSTAEGIGLFVAANVVTNIGRPDLLLPAMALVVGLHFLPIARAVPSRPFALLGVALIAAAVLGALAGPPTGARLAGGLAALALWTASVAAVLRDQAAKRAGPDALQQGAGEPSTGTL